MAHSPAPGQAQLDSLMVTWTEDSEMAEDAARDEDQMLMAQMVHEVR